MAKKKIAGARRLGKRGKAWVNYEELLDMCFNNLAKGLDLPMWRASRRLPDDSPEQTGRLMPRVCGMATRRSCLLNVDATKTA